MGRVSTVIFVLMVVLSCAMGAVLYWHNAVFVLNGPDNGFLLTKTEAIRYSVYLPAFYIHIVTGSVVLVLGVFQLSKLLRNSYTRWHRKAGKLYVFIVLMLTAPSGFIMSFYANGGWIAKSGFALLAILWWFFTWRGFRNAVGKEWDAHRRFMLRSYALTFAAVTLRLYSFLFALAGFRGENIYHIIVWLCWVPSLLAVELWLWKKPKV